ncbi:MAG: tRNA pseudouridine(55) synthase TruB [candidate division Zixibacteria bacterium]
MAVRDGIMLIDKPTGMTSHDVVDFLRQQLKIRRVGHTGILDPNATGLMLMLIGKGTKFSSLLTKLPKQYVARLIFGATTDTYDAEGKILSRAEPGNLKKADFEKKLQDFMGEIEQIVPPFSAAKKNGVPLYKLARMGKTMTPRHKMVRIDNIEIVEFDWPEVTLDISCSSGTYVRSIAQQMGERLGCGGYLKNLRRLKVGQFHISAALTPEEVSGTDDLSGIIRPLKDALPTHPAIHIKPQYYGAVLSGRPLVKRYIAESNYSGDGDILSMLLGPDDKVLALAKLNMLWRAVDRLGPSEIMGTYVRVIDEGHLRA